MLWFTKCFAEISHLIILADATKETTTMAAFYLPMAGIKWLPTPGNLDLQKSLE